MISLANINGRKKVEQGFSSNKRDMDDTELEEGEAWSYHDDNDTTIDPDIALSYIDEKLQNYLGHFKKDFEGVVSAESLGAKYGIYGSFLPAHRRSPHSRSPPRVHNHSTPQSSNALQPEGGHHNSLPPANISSSIKPGSTPVGSTSSYANKPPPQNGFYRQNTNIKPIQSLEERTPKSEVRDQKMLKVRIKVGSESLSTKKNAEIYSGLGLDGSPTSSPGDSLIESEGLSGKLSDGLESPTHILKMMTSSPLFEDCLLSPLPNDLMFLSERPKNVQDSSSFSGKHQDTISGVKSQRKMDPKKFESSPFPLKDDNIDGVSCEELVLNALKLPLLSNTPNDVNGSPKASLNERNVVKPKGITGKLLHNKGANIGNMKIEKEDCVADIGTNSNSKSRKVPKSGVKDQGSEKSSSQSDGSVLPSIAEKTLSMDEKREKKSQVLGFSAKQIVTETNKDSAKVLKERKFMDTDNNARRNDFNEVKDRYVDVFGEMNEQEVDIMDSPNLSTGKLKSSENTFREREFSLEAQKGMDSIVKLKGCSNIGSVSENGHLVSEGAHIPVDGNDNWVQCDKCQKWRMFPPGSKVDNLPPEWDCSLMTWLPNKNHCNVSEEESNNFHAPPLGMTTANIFSTGPINGTNTSKIRKSSKALVQDSPNRPSSSIRRKQQFVKEKTLKEPKESFTMNGIDHLQQPKSSDTFLETEQHKIIDKLGTDDYSKGGHAKITNKKSRKGSDQDLTRASKKSKIRSIQRDENDKDVNILSVNSDIEYPNSEKFSGQNSKKDTSGLFPDSLGKSNIEAEQIPIVGSVHVSNSSSENKKRKGDNFKDPLISTPLSGKTDDSEKSSRKRHRVSKSEGKESSSSKKSGKSEKKNKSVSHYKVDSNGSLQKVSLSVNPVAATTSSSSKVSGSLKVKCKFQEVKGSPVDSVSSSPLKILSSDKLASESKVIAMNDNVQDDVKIETNSSRRFSSVDYEDSGKDRNSIFDSGKVKAKTSVHQEKEKSGSNVDKSENGTITHSKEISLPKSEERQENDEKKNPKKFQVEKSEEVVPIIAKEKSLHLPNSDSNKNETSTLLQKPVQDNKATSSACDIRPDNVLSKESRPNKKPDSSNGTQISSKQISNGHRIKNQDAPSPLRRDSSSQAASSAIKEAKDLKHLADRLKSSGSTESTGMYFEAALKFLHGASLLESGKNEKHADIVQSMRIYSSTANLCQFCAHEFERSKDMATAALAYKCVEVAYLRVIYSSHNNASRDRHELQHALHMVPPGESPSSSASDIDNLNNTANGDKVIQPRNGGSPQLATNLVISAKNRPHFSRLLTFAQNVNFAMEASRKSHIAFTAASTSMGQSDSKDGITSIKRALDFNFHDVDGLLRLVRLAKEAINR